MNKDDNLNRLFDRADKINFAYRDYLREQLVSLGIEHIALSVTLEGKNPHFLAVRDLSERIHFAAKEKMITILERYSVKSDDFMEEKMIKLVNDDVTVRYFCCTELVVKDIHPNLYILKIRLECNSTMMLFFHTITTLNKDRVRLLSDISRIIKKWVISWLAHQRLLFSILKFSGVEKTVGDIGLTQAEHEVLDLMLIGYTTNRICIYRQVSKETVRSQIKSILGKTGCRSQNELIATYSYFNHFCSPLFD